MNKKQLRIQNSSFLAELERKAKETEILNIRLEQAEQDYNTLSKEHQDLVNLAKELEAKNQELAEKLIALDAALTEANAKLEKQEAINSALPVSTEEPCEVNEEKAEVEQTEPKQAESEQEAPTTPLTEIDFEIKQKIEQIDALTGNEDATEQVIAEPAAPLEGSNNIEIPSPTNIADTVKPEAEYSSDFLRDYGAKIIARVTRATAEVIARAALSNEDVSKSLKTLALGKNESFKYQVMELTKQKDAPQKAVEEMDLLAEETIVYLKSI